TPATPGTPIGDIDVASPAFEHGGAIPERFTGDGADVSPPLTIDGVPDEAASISLLMDDPDAPNPPFTHWLCWALPPDTDEIPEAVPQTEQVLDGAIQGENDFGELGYRGPLPPADDGPHRYRFTVAALETPLDLEPGATRSSFDDAMAGVVIDRGRLVGTYNR
ncbi:MAG: YbhB/YbcL family Raf kinase inhibitor-like protein, partial [Salinirussus sp.]